MYISMCTRPCMCTAERVDVSKILFCQEKLFRKLKCFYCFLNLRQGLLPIHVRATASCRNALQLFFCIKWVALIVL